MCLSSPQNTGSQEVLGWGWLLWPSLGGATSQEVHTNCSPTVLPFQGELDEIQQVVCTACLILVVTKTGRLYKISFPSDTQVPICGLFPSHSD